MAVLNPHFAIPFRWTNVSGHVQAAVVEHNSYDEIFGCVEVLARYTRGFIEEEPDFGVTDQTFAQDFNTELLRDELAENEPRAVTVISAQPDRYDALIQRIRAEVYRSEEASA